MHSLVRWRAGVELDADEYKEWYAVFTAAVCAQFAKELDKVQFWRHVGVHLASGGELLHSEAKFTKGSWDGCGQ